MIELEVGDPVEVFSRGKRLIAGTISCCNNNNILHIGKYLFNCSNNTLSFQKGKKKRIILKCSIVYSKKAEMELELLALRDILIDEIYYFFNHDTEVNNQIPTEVFNNSLRKLTLKQLITITKIIIPFGYGTGQEFSELINLSKKMIGYYTITTNL